MKEFTLITYQSGAGGYYIEDDWQEITKITSCSELYEALKKAYLIDARNRNNYPIVSFPIGTIYTSDDLSQYAHTGSLEHRDLCDYNMNIISKSEIEYQNAFVKFNKWKKKVQSLIPILREKAKLIKQEKIELKSLFSLAEKYNYKLEKQA